MLGSFATVEPPHRLVFTFGWEQNAPGEPLAPGSTVVEVLLTPDGDGTVLVLRHSDMPVTHAADHAQGLAASTSASAWPGSQPADALAPRHRGPRLSTLRPAVGRPVGTAGSRRKGS